LAPADSQGAEGADLLATDNVGSIAEQYARDRRRDEYLFQVPGAERVFKPWTDLRTRLDEKYGFKPAISFTHIYQWASDTVGPEDDASGFELVLDGETLHELPADFYSSRSYADFLMDSIRENRGDGRPFLAYLALTSPHDPLHVPEPWLSKYAGRYDDGYEALKRERTDGGKRAGVVADSTEVAEPHPMVRPWDSLSEEDRALQRVNMEAYAGMVDNLDYHLGRVIDFLEDIGEHDDTVVIFLSDNVGNPSSNSAYGIGWATASSGPLNLFKMAVAEGGIRAPLIISGPGVEGPGRVSGAFSYVWDVMPTILDLAGIQHPAKAGDSALLPMKGRSMAGVLSGESDTVHEPGTLIGGEMFGGRWISDGTHEAVRVAPPYGNGTWKLYNLAEDPGEARNIAQENPDLLERLETAWDQYAADVGVVFPE
jgi:arylsulfatase